MITGRPIPSIYIYNCRTDFRKGIDGLAGIVSEELRLNVFSGSLFIFFSRRRDKIKVLYWDRTGFAVWHKRLEKEKFFTPKKISDIQVAISEEEFRWLLNGYDVWKMKPHEVLQYTSV